MCPIYIAVRTQKRRQIYIPKLPSDILLKLLLYNKLRSMATPNSVNTYGLGLTPCVEHWRSQIVTSNLGFLHSKSET